ncbi:MAG TPA: sensor domain-containing diguanylate cyclase [Solirubrobacteraceae bacterium]|jgi:diguanylate cyclase (GGDEF)-like protein/PAS domain S-box-containing protein|nr:sensor domain-containing diguanylate cyclase [Solirubrobacteraceae bacterium]
MDRASIAHPPIEQAERLPNAAPSAISHALREIAETGAHDPERALDLACERLVQSIAAAERLRTELRARCGELRTLENRMHVTTEMLSEGVLVFDLHGRTIYANNAAARILSMSHDQLLARHVRDRRWHFLHEDSSPWPTAGHPAAETLQTGRCARAVTIGVRKPGGAITWISLSSRPAHDEHGRQCGAIATFADISERRTILEQLRHQAHHDQLTNLANRRLFHKELDRAISQAQRHGCAVALVYMDLNGFKQVNDTLGHRSGDEVLRTIAERLSGAIRDDELISRYGGDEFVALLSMLRLPATEVEAFMERMRLTLAEPIRVQAGAVKVGASLGASVYPHDGSSAEQLLHHADAAMLAMKGSRAAA